MVLYIAGSKNRNNYWRFCCITIWHICKRADDFYDQSCSCLFVRFCLCRSNMGERWTAHRRIIEKFKLVEKNQWPHLRSVKVQLYVNGQLDLLFCAHIISWFIFLKMQIQSIVNDCLIIPYLRLSRSYLQETCDTIDYSIIFNFNFYYVESFHPNPAHMLLYLEQKFTLGSSGENEINLKYKSRYGNNWNCG